jgi:hypothetical protein
MSEAVHVRFHLVRERPHEEVPVRPKPSIGSVVVALTIKPPEQLPEGVEFADVVEQVAAVVRKPVEQWYEAGGRELLMSAPDVA